MQSMHNLDFSGSSFRKHQILTAIAGLLGIAGIHLAGFFALVSSVLFPRRERVYGSHPDSDVIGRLTFGQKVHDTEVPIHHMRVEMWARTWWFGYRKLAEAFTDRDGCYGMVYDLAYARSWWIFSVRVEMYTTGNHRWEKGKAVSDYLLFETAKIKKRDLVQFRSCKKLRFLHATDQNRRGIPL